MLSEELEMLRSNVREFVSRHVEPIAREVDERDEFPRELFREMGKQGYLGITVPERYGGSGLGYTAQSVVQEELGYSSASIALSYGAHSNLCLDNLYRNGNEHIREEFVPRLCSGEWIGSLCLTEPGSGSDALAMRTSVTEDRGEFVLNGSKTLITNAPYADLMLVYARDGDGYSAFAVRATDRGVSKGSKFSKMGMRGSPTGELHFQDVRLGPERLVGQRGKARDVILSGLNMERVILAYLFLGLGRRAFDMAMAYSVQRKQGGREINEFELVEQKLANMYTYLRTSRLLCDDALGAVSRDPMDGVAASSAIYWTAESAEYCAREAVQVMGGYGYIRDSGAERLLRDAVLGQIGAGTREIREHVIARGLVKRYKREGSIRI
ncbi:isovaleryl-CoA dehydrogenase [Thermogymnomonas acidicola]|uniref:Isovaleryl-CoA dehydrogenase n=1 Tax=Thermogymnomonas acidicola TaxID=399579 RepID=A0AA37BRS6_9ARCH|nr:acyl-CoA dehydrogenase family protein [Thermogymnomonas acidicola]GGM75586.1 isovaleryl-CoA dehydrogenase [Thermogymnomonas acidicola]